MICIGENSPHNEIKNVSITFLLSGKPLIGTEGEFFEAIVILPTETYEEAVWSAFSTNSGAKRSRRLGCNMQYPQHSIQQRCILRLPVKCSLYVENMLELNAHSLYLHYSQVVLVFVASGS